MRSLRSVLVVPALLALACATAARAAAQSPPEAEMRFSTGVMHLREGRVDLALEEFKRAVKDDPKNPYFQKGLGQAFAAKRDWGSAISAFRKALELNPLYVDTRNDLGYALLMSGDRDGGQAGVPRRLQRPDEPGAGDLGLQPRARLPRGEELRRGDELVPLEHRPQQGLRLAHTCTSQRRSSPWGATRRRSRSSRRACATRPRSRELLLALGRVYLKVGRLAEARTRLDEALKADPGGAVGRAAAEQLKTAAPVEPCPTGGFSRLCWPRCRAPAPPCCSTSRARWSSGPASSTNATG